MTMMVSFGFVLAAFAQTRIAGKVTDANGKPISNVSVTVKGTTVGTSTAADGTYSLTAPAGAKSVEFSSIGFEKQSVTIASGRFSPVMQTAIGKEGPEVIITGLSRVKKSQFVGAANKISSKELEDRPVGSFDQLLQGRAPGILALTSSGQPGTASTIIIRGQNSVEGGVGPLYVVDGIPVEAGVFQGINPNDIASIDVLRDAATAALYGSRGAGGVIVVTTKRGTAGKAKLSYSVQMGMKSKPEFAFTPMNSAQLLDAQRRYGAATQDNENTNIPGWYYYAEGNDPSKWHPRFAGSTSAQRAAATRTLKNLADINTDWYDEFFRTGNFSNHEISLTGGTGKTRFFNSLALYNEEGIINPSDMKRVSFRNNLDFSDEKLNLSISSAFAYTKRNLDLTFPGFIFNSFLTPNMMVPYVKVRNADGSYNVQGSIRGDADRFAPQFLDLKAKDLNYNNQLKATIGFTSSYQINKNLVAAATAGFDFRETQSTVYGNREAYVRTPASFTDPDNVDPRQLAGSMSESLTRFLTMNVRPSVTYTKTFKEVHDLELSAVGEYVQENAKSISATGYGIDPRTPNTIGVVTQGDQNNFLFAAVGGGRSQNSIASGLATLRYTYDDKYTLTGSFRRDGSSKLPKETRWTSFYSIGGIWDVMKENFAEKLNVMDALRLRLSYGGAGNANNFPGDYLYQATYGTGSYIDLITQQLTYPGNKDVKWESTFTLNFGLDFEMFNRRLYGDFNVYSRITKDLFIQRNLTAEAGGYSIIVNAGKLGNKGFEWNVNYDVIQKKNVRWTIFTTGAYNKNELLSLNGEPPYESGTSFLKEGLPLGSHYEVKYAGVDASTGQPLYYDLNGNVTPIYSASNAVTDFGTWESPWKGGFGTNLIYKNFDLNVFFSWQYGANKFDNLEYFVENPAFISYGYNQSTTLDFWEAPGDIAALPSPLYPVNFTSKLIHDASFVRLRDVNLGYTLPQQMMRKVKYVSKAKLYVQANNIFMWTKWRGSDPEAGAPNINLREFPNPRSITAGLNVTF
jgi:TonB-linked SusC/RagA family outer membrane protein